MTEPPAPDRGSPAPGGSASRLVARNAIFRTGGEVVAKLASIAFFVAVARELGGGGFGDFVFALSFTTVLILLAGFGTEELVAREVARDRARVHEYLSNVVALKAASSVAILLLAALVVNLAGYDGDVRTAVYLVGAGVAVENLGRTWHSVFQAFQRMEFISISLILQRVVTAAAGIAVLLAGKGLLAVSAVYLGGALLGFITNFWAMRRFVVGPRLELDRSRWWPIMKMGIPIGLVTVLFTVLMKVDQSLLRLLSPPDRRSSFPRTSRSLPMSCSSTMSGCSTTTFGAGCLARLPPEAAPSRHSSWTVIPSASASPRDPRMPRQKPVWRLPSDSVVVDSQLASPRPGRSRFAPQAGSRCTARHGRTAHHWLLLASCV